MAAKIVTTNRDASILTGRYNIECENGHRYWTPNPQHWLEEISAGLRIRYCTHEQCHGGNVKFHPIPQRKAA